MAVEKDIRPYSTETFPTCILVETKVHVTNTGTGGEALVNFYNATTGALVGALEKIAAGETGHFSLSLGIAGLKVENGGVPVHVKTDGC